MELGKIVVGSGSVNLDSLNKNEWLAFRSPEELRGGGPLPIKPLVFEILSLKNSNSAMNQIDYQKINLAEGKNRAVEQIDDSNLLKDSELNKIRKGEVDLLLSKVVNLISEEVNPGYKSIMLIYLLESEVVTSYKNYFILDEDIDLKDENLKEVAMNNKRMNVILKRAIEFIENEILFKDETLLANYMNNKKVSQNMKDHLNTVGIQWIKKSKSTNTVYKSFRRKAKMDKVQQFIFQDFVTKLRSQNREKLDRSKLCEIFHITIDYYNENEAVALEPLDDLMNNIQTFDFETVGDVDKDSILD